MTELFSSSIKRKTAILIGLVKQGEDFITACSKSGLSTKKAKNILFYNRIKYKKTASV